MTNVTIVTFSVRRSERRRVRLLRARGRRISSGEADKDDESLGGGRHEPVTLESAHDPNGRLRCDPDHVGHVLPGHPNR